MRNEKLMFIGLVVLIVISSLAVILLIQQNSGLSEILKHEKVPKIGDKAYLFTTESLDGTMVSIKDTTTLLVFMNTQCQTCAMSLPVVNAAYDSLRSLGVQVIGIISEPDLIARSYIEEHVIPFPVIADPDKKIFKKSKIRTVMLTVLVDKIGKIQYYQNYGDGIKRTLEKVFHQISNEVL
jgi:peroxiredoxin